MVQGFPASSTPVDTLQRYTRLGSLWLNRGERAKAWYDRARAEMGKVGPVENGLRWWQPLVEGYVLLDQLPDAIQVAQSIPNPQARSETLQQLTCSRYFGTVALRV